MTAIPTVPSRYLLRLVEVLEESGIDPAPYLRRQRISKTELGESKRRLDYDSFVALVAAVVADTDIPALGLTAGRRIQLVDHGILGYAFISSANLRKAFEIFAQYQKIQGPIVNVSLRTEGRDAIYAAEKARPIDADLYKYGIASWLGEVTNIRSLFDPGELEFTSATVTFPESRGAALYRELLRCDVHFGGPANELRFPDKNLDVPFSFAEESVAELCAHQCEEILREMSSEQDIVDDVRRTLLKNPGESYNLNSVAKELAVSSRTLRRRLQEADTSFRVIQTEVRMSLAGEYLSHTPLPIAEIAHLLGYSDVTAFHRSFKKHFDVTPAQYRK
jgi:AraC-like DNA-binding protein